VGDARQRLLAGAIEYVAENGVNNLTLRRLAAELGTSHRMLLYHFGSKEGLLVEVVREVERRQRQALAELERELDANVDGVAAAAELTRRFWARLADPAMARYERLFFELYGHALQRDPGAAPLLDGVVESWLAPLTELVRTLGVPAESAPARARLGLAVVRGLLLDLLATGDRAGVDAALEEFIAGFTHHDAAQSGDGAAGRPSGPVSADSASS
jgi:AcrR family transcriptional regulator